MQWMNQIGCGLAIVTMLMFASPSARGAITAEFTGGNGTASVDQWTGIGGDGWTGGWTSLLPSGDSATVTNTAPLNGAGDNYLSVADSTAAGAGNHNIARTITSFGDVDTSQPYTIRWKWRFDGDVAAMEAGGFNDRIHFYGNNGTTNGTSSSNSWVIGWASADAGALTVHDDHWYFFDNNTGTAFNTDNQVDTGLGLIAGVVYEFVVTVDPAAGLYDASIDDGVNNFSAASLKFRNGLTGQFNSLHFGTNTTDGATDSSYALDSVNISAVTVVPTPAALPAGILMLGAMAMRRR